MCLYVLSGEGTHRALHSFPTRRSSDLVLNQRPAAICSAVADAPAAALIASSDGRGDQGDRKSTRLNSSHLVISYAVFCLKKKKETQSGTEGSMRQGQRTAELWKSAEGI